VVTHFLHTLLVSSRGLETGGFESGSFGVRGVPVGSPWLPRSTLLDVFLEVAPTVLLTPAARAGMARVWVCGTSEMTILAGTDGGVPPLPSSSR
jgi:hypothetical protein